MRMIYLDINAMSGRNLSKKLQNSEAYLKLLNRRDQLDFRIKETYLLGASTVIGRSKQCNLSIDDPFLSSEHIKINEHEGNFILTDLGSTNGTYLNDTRMSGNSINLKTGDKIGIGQIQFLFINE